MFGGAPIRLSISIAPCEQVGLLIGKEVLRGLDMILDFGSNQMDVTARSGRQCR